jgi:SNF2 family DNA or RNA helicase
LTQNLADIFVEPATGTLLCKARDSEGRARLAALARKLAPGASIKVDGGLLALDLRAALALRNKRGALSIRWSEEAAGFVDNFAASYASLGRARRRLSQLQQSGMAEEVLSHYPAKMNLDAHQLVAVAAMSDPAILGICLFDEQGVGKTVMAIHAFDRLKQTGEADTLLVFAPKNMLEEWRRDFSRFMGDKHRLAVVTGSKGEKYDQLLGKAAVYVTNYETAHLLEGPLRSFLRRRAGRVVLAVDESFFVKNRATKRAAAVRRLRHLCSRSWVLCGTPAPNNALDVVHQFDVADGGATFAGIELPKEPYALRQKIKEVVELRGVYLRRLKQDVLPDLPKKCFERVLVPMEAEQRQLYAGSLSALAADVEAVDERGFKKQLTSFLGRRMALFEICSHPGQIYPAYGGVPAKLTALDGLLEELIERQGEKVVLWSFFRYSLQQLCTRFEKYNPVRIDGSVAKTPDRAKAVTRFQEDESTMLFIGNPAAAGVGITLTRSHVSIYESLSVQAAHYLQSLDRIHRRGQTREAKYYILLCKDSIEEGEYDRLLMKERLAQDLFADPQPDLSRREVFLDELLDALRKL